MARPLTEKGTQPLTEEEKSSDVAIEIKKWGNKRAWEAKEREAFKTSKEAIKRRGLETREKEVRLQAHEASGAEEREARLRIREAERHVWLQNLEQRKARREERLKEIREITGEIRLMFQATQELRQAQLLTSEKEEAEHSPNTSKEGGWVEKERAKMRELSAKAAEARARLSKSRS